MEAFLAVLRNVTQQDTVQYVLALLEDMVGDDEKYGELFLRAKCEGGADTFTVLLRLLQRHDWFTQEKASVVLATALANAPEGGEAPAPAPGAGAEEGDLLGLGDAGPSARPGGSLPMEKVVSTFLEFLCGQLRRPSHPEKSVPSSVHCLSKVLRQREARAMFLQAQGLHILANLLKDPESNPQFLYELVLCVWLLSYLPEAVQGMAKLGIPASLGEVARNVQKEKVLRVTVMALKNILKDLDQEASSDLTEAGLHKILAILKLGAWSDEELLEGLDWLGDKMEDCLKTEVSSFTKYRKEVSSGKLEWTVLHKEQKFWRMNIGQFQANAFHVVKLLAELLKSSSDPTTLAVACHDIGQFIVHHPRGREVVQDLNVKLDVMKLLQDSSPEVQKEALLCTQKIMLGKDTLSFVGA